MELYAKVRRAVQVEGMSEREAVRQFGIARETVRKMLRYAADHRGGQGGSEEAAAYGQIPFTGRAQNRASAAKREAERLLVPLDWLAPSAGGLRDPEILQVAELELD